MKIVHVIWSFNIGGAETMLANLANEQAALGQSVSVIIINDSYDKELLRSIDDDVEVILLNRKPGSRSPLPIIKLNSLLLKCKPDVIHSHVGSIIEYLIKPLHRKTVLTMHTTGIVTPRKTLYKYSGIFAISDSVKQVLKEKFNIDAITITNGVVFKKIKHKQPVSNYGSYRIVNIGRLVDDIKGQSTLIKAASILPDDANVSIDIIGDGPDMPMLLSLRSELNVESKVNLLGAKGQAYIHEHLQDYDLLVQPSFIEGFGLTIVEGMAAKLPVLVSDIDGTSEVICNGEYGEKFKVGNHYDLAAKIMKIKKNPEIYIKRTELAYKYAEEHYSLLRTARQYIKNYERYL